jgi:hypothetical protein
MPKTKRHWYKASLIAMRSHALEPEIETLRQYVLSIEGALSLQQKEFDGYVSKQKDRMSPEQFEEYCEFCSEEYWQLGEVFPELMRTSTFVALVSKIEHDLVSLCGLIQRNRKINVKFKKLGGATTLESVRAYIKDHTTIDIGVQRKWKTLDTLNTVRNAIVHNDGCISVYKRDRVKSYARRNRGILRLTSKREFPKNKVVLNEGFLEHVLDIMASYFEATYKKMRRLGI